MGKEPTQKDLNVFMRWARYLQSPVDMASLAWFRIVFGGALLAQTLLFGQYISSDGRWLGTHFHFSFVGFSWLHPWPAGGMFWHLCVLGLLAFCVMIGFCYQITSTLCFIAYTYVFLLDKSTYQNHWYLLSLIAFLMVFIPAGRAASVDAWLCPKRACTTIPRWTIWALRIQIGIPFFFGGIAKLHPDWLSGEPMRMILSRKTDFPIIGSLFNEPWMAYLYSYSGVLLDLLIVPFLLWRPTRMAAYLVALMFHLSNLIMFPEIGVFPWFMIGATTIFFEPKWPRSLTYIFRRTTHSLDTLPDSPTPECHAGNNHFLVLFVIYFAVQSGLPLRHWLYPGDVNWTQEGNDFAWRMKMTHVRSRAQFYATDPTNQKTWEINPMDYMVMGQLVNMRSRPAMILQFASAVAHDLQRKGHHTIEVRAKVAVSLNGRRSQMLIDPTVDLAAKPRNHLPTRWINPLSIPLVQRFDRKRYEQHFSRTAIEMTNLGLMEKAEAVQADHYGQVAEAEHHLSQAIKHFRQALHLNPESVTAHKQLATILQSGGKLDLAIAHWVYLLRNQPEDADAHNNLAIALVNKGHFAAALQHFQQAIEIRPQWATPHNGIAWILASNPDKAVHNPSQAMHHAQRAAELSGHADASILDTLAVAYAATDQFHTAIQVAKNARNLAIQNNQPQVVLEIESRLKLYEQSKTNATGTQQPSHP